MANNLPVKASTQDHLDIEDIIDDLVLQKDGTVALILETTALNFGLLSEPEQDAVIYSYAAMLNSLTFPVQVLIRSKRSDISEYLERLSEAEQAQTNRDLRSQIKNYRDFITATVQKNEVLEKKFYLIIPFSILQVGAKGTMVGISKKQKGALFSKKYILGQAKNELVPKRDHLLKQLSRIGLKAHQLENHELIELLYDIYNPQEVGLQKITQEAGSYTAPIVGPSIVGQEQVVQEAPVVPQPEVGQQSIGEEAAGPQLETPTLPVQTAPSVPEPQPQPATEPVSPSQEPMTQTAQTQDQKAVMEELQAAVTRANSLLAKQGKN